MACLLELDNGYVETNLNTYYIFLSTCVFEISYSKKFIKIFLVWALYNQLSYKSVTGELETVFYHSFSVVKQLRLYILVNWFQHKSLL